MFSSTDDIAVDVICLSHLRWNFVFQRPQHLMTRCAADRRVFFVEEPERHPSASIPALRVQRLDRISVVTPVLSNEGGPDEADAALRKLLDQLLETESISKYALWYYTPMAIEYTRHLRPQAVIYDCMDELSAFRGAPSAIGEREKELMRRADLMLTGGQSLYEAKRHQHENIHPFPSSVDIRHFAQARRAQDCPADQAGIPRPRLGFFGVVDERMDLELIAGVADARPDWHIVMLGPVVKIEQDALPRRPNIHYLGQKSYSELPDYIRGWDVALLPFARNEATRYISPTKTPEYMAAGKPVVSTSIADVVRPYGREGLVRIADSVPEFVTACSEAMAEDSAQRLRKNDAFLSHMSWDRTWRRIWSLASAALHPSDAGDLRSAVVAPRDAHV